MIPPATRLPNGMPADILDQMAPPVVPGITELPPDHSSQPPLTEKEDISPEAHVLSTAGYLFAEAAELGPETLKMVLDIGQAVYKRVKEQQSERPLDFFAMNVGPIGPPIGPVVAPPLF